ncbi:MAG: hypothetical protein ACJA1U_000050 [Bermanella sp.]|jgi:hypothetical protein
MKLIKGVALVSALGMLAACGSSSDSDEDNNEVQTATYTFPSKLIEGESSVNYTGQTARQLLIGELKSFISSDALQVDFTGTAAEAKAELMRIYTTGVSDDGTSLVDVNIYGSGVVTDISITVDAPLTLEQVNYADVYDAASKKDLEEKIAGFDNTLSMDQFIGWTVVGTEDEKPNALLQSWFDEIATLATDGDDTTTYVNDAGHDLNQLVQKFLFGAVTYSQAARDYLKADKGLLKQNTTEDKDGKPYTSLEHQWDEGFGYFGAATHYLSKTDAEIKASAVIDANGDKSVDLFGGEYNFGLAVYASKMDLSTGTTDYSKQAMEAFIEGRELIQANFGTDPAAGEGYHVELVEIAERALAAMENVIATATIHYINTTISDIEAYAPNNDFSTIAKHWSEMKGFALSLQFSPVAKITEAQLINVHNLIGTTPKVDVNTDPDAYIEKLKEARTTLQTVYGYDAEAVKAW